MMNMRGYLYTLEVLVALSVIFAAIVFVFRTPPQKPEIEISLIKQQGFEALQYMDEKGELRKYVSENKESYIENSLKNILPNSIKFETELCTASCSQVGVPSDKTVIIVDYYISGYRGTYSFKKVRLYMWKTY